MMGCHRRGQGLLLWDGTIKNVEDIQVGDLLMGPDSKPRAVLSLCRGFGQMAEIRPIKGNPFVVNMNHMLTLFYAPGKARDGIVLDISVKDYLARPDGLKQFYKLIRMPVSFHQIEQGYSPHPGLNSQVPAGEAMQQIAIFSSNGNTPISPREISRATGIKRGTIGACLSRDKGRTFTSTSTGEYMLIPNPTYLPLGPYFVGAMIGDGSLSGGNTSTCIINEDEGVIAAFKAEAARHGLKVKHKGNIYFATNGNAGGVRNPILSHLKDLGLIPLRCEERFIPMRYKTASKKHRLQLLAGLIDTDGHLTDTWLEYLTKSPALAQDVAFIARSVGLAAYIQRKQSHTHFGEKEYDNCYWRVGISGDYTLIPSRKHKPKPREQKKSVLRTGFSIVPQGTERFYGFTLSGDGRYLLDDFTVTHNSGKTLSAVTLCYLDWKNNGRRIFSNNKLQFDHTWFDTEYFVTHLADDELENATILLDEAYIYLDARAGQSKLNKLFTYFIVQTRKRGVDLYVCTHHIDIVDKRLRRAVDVRGSCLLSGTAITTESGQVPIKDIQPGTKILTYNQQTGCKELDEVTNIGNRWANSYLIIKLSNGNELRITDEHPIQVVGKGWVEASNISVGDELVQIKYPFLAQRINLLKRGADPIWKAAHSEKLKRQWSDPTSEYNDPEFRRIGKQVVENGIRHPTRLELELQEILDRELSGVWTYTGDSKLWLTCKGGVRINPDFVISPGMEKAIEVFAPFWKIKQHGNVESYITERQSLYNSIGCHALFIPDDDLHSDEEGAVTAIKEFTYNPDVEIVKVVSVERVDVCHRVYNLETRENHNYFAYGVLVHNCRYHAESPCRRCQGTGAEPRKKKPDGGPIPCERCLGYGINGYATTIFTHQRLGKTSKVKIHGPAYWDLYDTAERPQLRKSQMNIDPKDL